MYDHLEVPQGIQTLADASPGARVVVHSVMGPYHLIGTRMYPHAGEDLACTRLLGDRLEFQRANGSTFRIPQADARRIRVERFEENEEADWCVR